MFLHYNLHAIMTCTIVQLYVGDECRAANFVSDSDCTNESVSLSKPLKILQVAFGMLVN